MTITATDLQTLTIAYRGQPFAQIAAYGIDAFELDIAYLGQPFVALTADGPTVMAPAGGGAPVRHENACRPDDIQAGGRPLQTSASRPRQLR